MKLTFTKLAMISAVVLTFAATSQEAAAQSCVNSNTVNAIDAQVPETLNICATIDNVFTTHVTDVDFQTIGATNNTGEVGCLILAATTAGAIDESNATCDGAGGVPVLARLVSNDEAGQAGLIAIDPNGAFVNQEIRMQFEVTSRTLTCTDDGTGTPANLLLQRLFSSQTTPATWTYDGTSEASSNALAVVGGQLSDAADGHLDIYIGAEIQTDGTTNVYDSGECAGTFDVTLFY